MADLCVINSCTGADPGFVNGEFVLNAHEARGKILGGHAYFYYDHAHFINTHAVTVVLSLSSSIDLARTQYKPRASSSRDYLALSSNAGSVAKCLKHGAEKGGFVRTQRTPPGSATGCSMNDKHVAIVVLIAHLIMAYYSYIVDTLDVNYTSWKRWRFGEVNIFQN